MEHPAALLELTIAPNGTHWHEMSLGKYLQSGRHRDPSGLSPSLSPQDILSRLRAKDTHLIGTLTKVFKIQNTLW